MCIMQHGALEQWMLWISEEAEENWGPQAPQYQDKALPGSGQSCPGLGSH